MSAFKDIVRLAKAFKKDYDTLQDLIQEGMIGVLNACETYDPSGAGTFKTYARVKARFAMLNYLRIDSTIPRCSRTASKGDIAFYSVPTKHSEILKLSVDRGISYEKVLNFSLARAGEDFETDLLTSTSNPSVEAERMEEYELFCKNVSNLSPREFEVIKSRLVDGETLRTIAKQQGISFPTVHRLIEEISCKLQIQ